MRFERNFFSTIEAHLDLKFGECYQLYTEFFSVKNSTPRGVGSAILYMIPNCVVNNILIEIIKVSLTYTNITETENKCC